MTYPKPTFLAENIQVVPQYEQLRDLLSQENYVLHRTKPLAFWALPTDRRLPLALLDRPLGDLLQIPFEDICRTPSIGEKKIISLLTLLMRAVQTKKEEIPEKNQLKISGDEQKRLFLEDNEVFSDSTYVSEFQWQKWKKIIAEYGLQDEKLGRLCPTLNELTRVIWNNTFGYYCSKSLTELRDIRTHGEKRITAILKIFHNVCGIVGKLETSKHLITRFVPRNIYHVENWTLQVLMKRGLPTQDEIDANYIFPLLEQLKIDSTPQVYELAHNRVGLSGDITSIRQASRTFQLARARIYQLLNEINDIAVTRWHNGRLLTSLLRNKFLRESSEQHNPEFARFHAAAELFFPWGRREDAGDDYIFQFLGSANDFADDIETEFSSSENWNEPIESEDIPKSFPMR